VAYNASTSGEIFRIFKPAVLSATLACALLCLLTGTQLHASETSLDSELAAVQAARHSLSANIEQFEQSLLLLLPDGTRVEDSNNPAVNSLAGEMLRLQQRLAELAQRELVLTQAKLDTLRAEPTVTITPGHSDSQPPGETPAKPDTTREAEDVTLLLGMLSQYHADQEKSRRTQPSIEQMARRDAAQRDARQLTRTAFSASKVWLNGSEGNTALAQISERLSDSSIAETRHDLAALCGIKTRLFGALIASESRALKPVGKNQYVARWRLQPGDTTFRIKTHSWNLQLPENIAAADYLVTLYLPPNGTSELHVVAVDALLGQAKPYLPAWLPDEIQLKPQTG
jgi:multidrug efflux pump subunit AcrA (membrane-fusion protein)